MEWPGIDRCPRYWPEYFTSSGIYASLNLLACAVAPNKTLEITVCRIPSARYENGKALSMPLAGNDHPPPNLELAICILVREASWCYLGCKHLLDEVLCLTLSHFKVECLFCFVAPKVGAINLTTVFIYDPTIFSTSYVASTSIFLVQNWRLRCYCNISFHGSIHLVLHQRQSLWSQSCCTGCSAAS